MPYNFTVLYNIFIKAPVQITLSLIYQLNNLKITTTVCVKGNAQLIHTFSQLYLTTHNCNGFCAHKGNHYAQDHLTKLKWTEVGSVT